VTPTWITRARVQFDEEESKQGAKEEVGDLQEITGPHLLRMVVQEGGPVLSALSWGASMPHVLLNGAASRRGRLV
jgi:hypothetical protein